MTVHVTWKGKVIPLYLSYKNDNEKINKINTSATNMERKDLR